MSNINFCLNVLDPVVVTARRRPFSPPLGFGFSFPSVPFMSGGGGAALVGPAPPQRDATQAPPPPEPIEDKDAKKMTYEHLMFHLEKLESLFPDIPNGPQAPYAGRAVRQHALEADVKRQLARAVRRVGYSGLNTGTGEQANV